MRSNHMNPTIIKMALRALERHERAEHNTVTLCGDKYHWLDGDDETPPSAANAYPSAHAPAQ
jgi:hypothetical protein